MTDIVHWLEALAESRERAFGPPGMKGVRFREAAREIKRLRAALKECGAPFMSPPTTVMGASAYVAEEFERRMNIAASALNDGTREPPVAAKAL